MSFEKLKSTLLQNGYGRLTEELTEQQTIDMIKDEMLDDEINISLPFESNEKIISNKFYEKNYPITIYNMFTKEDVKDIYLCIQDLLK